MYQSMSALLHLGKSTTSQILWVEHFQPPSTFQMSYLVPPPALVPLVLSMFLAKHVTSQFRILILVAPCWMEACSLSIVVNIPEDIPHHCLILMNLIIDVSANWVLKGLPLLDLTLGYPEMCAVQTRVLFLCQSVAGIA